MKEDREQPDVAAGASAEAEGPATTSAVPELRDGAADRPTVRRRVALIGACFASAILIAVLGEHLIGSTPFGVRTALELALAAALFSVAEIQRAVPLGPRAVRGMDLLTLGLVSVATGVVAFGAGTLTSPIFLALALALLARTLLVPTPARWSLATALLASTLYPLTMAGAALLSDRVAADWQDPQSLVRFAFCNAAVLGFAGLGVFLATIRESRRQPPRQVGLFNGQIELVRKLGSDATGEIYRGRQAGLRRDCAVKLMHRRLLRDREALKRFDREMRLAAQLLHPHIVDMYAADRLRDGRPVYAMELLEGLTLRQVVEKAGPLPAPRVVHLLLQVSSALEYIHERGVLHANINPDSLFVTRRGLEYDFVKLLDFGSAQSLRGRPRTLEISEVRGGDFLGDPQYTPPEAVLGSPLDARSDLYCLAAVGYFLLTGRPLFEHSTASKILHAQVAEDPKTLTTVARSFVPQDIEMVITRALSKLPDYRFRDGGKLRQALLECESFGAWTPADARRWWSGVRPHDFIADTPPPRPDSDPTLPTRPDVPKRFILN